jgi:hypothetical protein
MTDDSQLGADASTENTGQNTRRGKVENLTPWQPGQSGNPGGRPRKLPITDYIIGQLEKPIPAAMKAKLPAAFTEVYGDDASFGEMLAFKVIDQAAKGDIRAMNTVMERAEGKVKQSVSLSGEDDNEAVIRVVHVGLAERMSEARKRADSI